MMFFVNFWKFRQKLVIIFINITELVPLGTLTVSEIFKMGRPLSTWLVPRVLTIFHFLFGPPTGSYLRQTIGYWPPAKNTLLKFPDTLCAPANNLWIHTEPYGRLQIPYRHHLVASAEKVCTTDFQTLRSVMATWRSCTWMPVIPCDDIRIRKAIWPVCGRWLPEQKWLHKFVFCYVTMSCRHTIDTLLTSTYSLWTPTDTLWTPTYIIWTPIDTLWTPTGIPMNIYKQPIDTHTYHIQTKLLPMEPYRYPHLHAWCGQL